MSTKEERRHRSERHILPIKVRVGDAVQVIDADVREDKRGHVEREERHPVTGTVHDGLCECCDAVLTEENLVEGDLGFYCSEECCDESEDSPPPYREDFHADG